MRTNEEEDGPMVKVRINGFDVEGDLHDIRGILGLDPPTGERPAGPEGDHGAAEE